MGKFVIKVYVYFMIVILFLNYLWIFWLIVWCKNVYFDELDLGLLVLSKSNVF